MEVALGIVVTVAIAVVAILALQINCLLDDKKRLTADLADMRQQRDVVISQHTDQIEKSVRESMAWTEKQDEYIQESRRLTDDVYHLKTDVVTLTDRITRALVVIKKPTRNHSKLKPAIAILEGKE